jgi:DNA polymerase-3 subunit gamma/tau
MPGRYIDLLEIDAASNTGVDNVRELIENAQYLPSRGRYKVYLIDEVHMLSKAAFNALLKTLEEPPEHVKFLFATTDPRSLLVTVLSRCLQFNLKRLDEQQITARSPHPRGRRHPGRRRLRSASSRRRRRQPARRPVAAGPGDRLHRRQARRCGGGDDAGHRRSHPRRRAAAALRAAMARHCWRKWRAGGVSPDWSGVLDALADALHRVQVRQLVPEAPVEGEGVDIDALAAALRPEVVQLWYQMALNGRRDLPLAPSPRAGFEMSVLRMLAFRPAEGEGARAPSVSTQSGRNRAAARGRDGCTRSSRSAANAAREALARDVHRTRLRPRDPKPRRLPCRTVLRPTPEPTTPGARRRAIDAESRRASAVRPCGRRRWHALIANSGLRGPARLLAEHSVFIGYERRPCCAWPAGFGRAPQVQRMDSDGGQCVGAALGAAPQIRFEKLAAQGESLRERNERARDERQTRPKPPS